MHGPLLECHAMTLTAAPLATAEPFELLARVFRAGGDALRLEILRALREDAYAVLELCRIFGMRQPALSHHLKVLAEAGLLARRREGTTIFYHRSPAATLDPAAQALLAAADAIGLREATAAGIARIREERARSSREFFAANARKFAEQQELIAPPAHYRASLEQLLDSACPRAPGTVLELGPGEGWLLPRLARQAARVIAIDNSPEMLAEARATVAAAGLGNVELQLGDGALAATLPGTVDIAVCNMVLHHTASPAEVIAELARSLRPGGVLLLTDLCAHDQAWARDACGDLWLGFAPEDLGRWARLAGLMEGEGLYLALRNGFRVQLRIFNSPQSRVPA